MFLTPEKAMDWQQYKLFKECLENFQRDITRFTHTVHPDADVNPLELTEDDFGCPVAWYDNQKIYRDEKECPVVMFRHRIFIPFRASSFCLDEKGRTPPGCRYCDSMGLVSVFSYRFFYLVVDEEAKTLRPEPRLYQAVMPCPHCETGIQLETFWKLNDIGPYFKQAEMGDKKPKTHLKILECLDMEHRIPDIGDFRSWRELKEAA